MRLAEKSANAVAGKYEISETSATAASQIVTGYIKQNTEDKSQAGKAKKRKDGIWLATIYFLDRRPSESAKDIFKRISIEKWESDDLRWEVYADGDKVIQKDYCNDKTSEIKFDTFKKEYFSKVKKMLSVRK